ncbi:hypothetical protein J4Q44_G00102470 [Coregonus suidteri]|uniref:Uncharacterized protein n=1 Tax=Coregonus suidteri TaxID=861788 RepID=A0AAN8MQP9_9TELE
MRADLLKITGAAIPLDFLQPLRQPTTQKGTFCLNMSDLVEDMLNGFSSLTKDDYYSEALVAMAKQYRAMKANPSRLVSAMHCFGKAHIRPAAKKAAALRRAARCPGPMIPCQPTAVARRTRNVGSKWCLTAGCPKTTNSGPEHPYCLDKKRKRPARFGHHNLSEFVAKNSSHQK